MKNSIKKIGIFLITLVMISAAVLLAAEVSTKRDQNNQKTTTSQNVTETVKSNKEDKTREQKPKDNDNEMDNKLKQSSLNVELKNGNSWMNGGKTCTQVDAVVKNVGQSDVNNWTISMKVPSGAKIAQSWNGQYSISGEILKVTPASYNVTVPAGGNITFGFIIETNDAFRVDSVVINSDNEVSITIDTNAEKQVDQVAKELKDAKAEEQTDDAKKLEPTSIPSSTGDWLYVKENKIVDKNGKQVWITGVNWFGYNTGTNTFDGLWAANLETSIEAIANRGFNLLRIPISTELIYSWSKGEYPSVNYNQAINPNLNSKNSLEIFDYVVALCRKNGIKIMIDIHSAKTDAMGHMYPVWYNGEITEQIYLDSLGWMAKRYKDDDTIIAYDLKNEPHGKANESPRAIWNNSKDPNNWKYIAEKAAFKVLESNPNVLIVVEGIEIYPKNIKQNGNYASQNPGDYYTNWWGGNLRGVKDYPINLGKYQNKLVYSPHDYGPTVYQQPWFKAGYTYESLYNDCWRDNWMYIYENKTAPLLIGEWGGFMKEPNLTWMTHLRKLIVKNKLHHTFWCFNANSGDTGGLVYDDFTTWDEEKYNFVKQALWTYNGKFVSLDQEIPLGKNGISLSQVK